VPYSLGEQTFRDLSSAVLRCYVDADLHGHVVGGLLAEGFEAEPTSDLPFHLPFHLRNPGRAALRVVLVKPGEAALDGDGLGISRNCAPRNSRVIGFYNVRKVRQSGGAQVHGLSPLAVLAKPGERFSRERRLTTSRSSCPQPRVEAR
jgi:hypothetical protein